MGVWGLRVHAMRLFARNDEPCMFCGETPASGAWSRPCPSGDLNAHWAPDQWRDYKNEHIVDLGQSLRRAAYELEKVAEALEGLSPRLRRKVAGCSGSVRLEPALVRNEAERARDTLHVLGLLDV